MFELKKVKKITICGLGSIGSRHLRIIKKNWPHLQIAALRSKEDYSPNFDKDIEGYIDQYFFSVDDTLKWSPDCVIISNPTSRHLEFALPFAKYSKHLLIEKPIGTGLEDKFYWDELEKYSRNIKILVGYVFRHEKGIKKMKELIKEMDHVLEADFYCGSWLPSWRPNQIDSYKKGVSSRQELGGGVLLELSHEIDLAYWIFGDLKINYSYLKKTDLLNLDVEDKALIHATSIDNDCSITFRLNFCSRPSQRKIRIIASDSYLEYDLLKAKLIFVKQSDKEVFEFNRSKDQKYEDQLIHFFECIEKDKKTKCNLHDAIKVLDYIKISKKINRNLKENCE